MGKLLDTEVERLEGSKGAMSGGTTETRWCKQVRLVKKKCVKHHLHVWVVPSFFSCYFISLHLITSCIALVLG